jgi:hypothetical protein
LILAAGWLLSYRLIRQADHDFIFDVEINSGLSVMALGLLLWIMLKDRREYIRSRTMTAFIPGALGLLTGIGLLTILFLLQQRDKSPSSLYCVSKIVDFNGASIDFREDGTYKLTSWCLGADYYRGSYTRQDSMITLDKSAIEKVIESNKLLVRQDGETDRLGNPGRSVYQIDREGRIIESAVDFRVLDSPSKRRPRR